MHNAYVYSPNTIADWWLLSHRLGTVAYVVLPNQAFRELQVQQNGWNGSFNTLF